MIKKLIYFTAALFFLILTYETILSFSTGIGGKTRKNSWGKSEIGCSCHNPDSLSSVQVKIYGPGVVAPGFVYTYMVTLKGGPAVKGGFDFNCYYGSIDTVAGEETINFGFDITHRQPKQFTSDSVSWLVKYIAKDTNAVIFDTLYAAGNSVNGNGIPDSTDRWNFSPNFIVKIDPSTIGVQNGGEIVKTFKLGQNYPNPFNPVTKINFSLSKTDYITLKIYNTLGMEIKTLVAESLGEGNYTVDWDAAGYPSGVYFYELTTGDFKERKKMVLIK